MFFVLCINVSVNRLAVLNVMSFLQVVLLVMEKEVTTGMATVEVAEGTTMPTIIYFSCQC